MQAINWLATQLAWERQLGELRRAGNRPEAQRVGEDAPAKAA